MISYKDSGVDIEAGNSFVEAIKPLIASTFTPQVVGDIGGFSGGFALPSDVKDPILFGATDGVGTKLKIAILAQKFDTIGIDLVAMCVNDLICSFATPLFFLDYFATGKLKIEQGVEIVKGIVKGAKEAECAVIGGETAEMPGIYKKGDFDLAGFAVGVASKNELETLPKVQEGDILVALPSSGLHSNGYSLVRKLFFEKLKMDLEEEIEGKSLKEILLEPTRIYVKEFKRLKSHLKALAHITGGGIVENLPRVLPKNLDALVDTSKLKIPPVFQFISNYVPKEEMFKTFNMGVGMVLVVSSKEVDEVLNDGYIIGEVVKGKGEVRLI